jgi:hypothetical protein
MRDNAIRLARAFIAHLVIDHCTPDVFIKLVKLLGIDDSGDFWMEQFELYYGEKESDDYKLLFHDFTSGVYCHFCFEKKQIVYPSTEFTFLCEKCVDDITDLGALECVIT